jgi:hypothetical protein
MDKGGQRYSPTGREPNTTIRWSQEIHTISKTITNVVLITIDEYHNRPFAGYNEKGFYQYEPTKDMFPVEVIRP